jgi:hypothetical protein
MVGLAQTRQAVAYQVENDFIDEVRGMAGYGVDEDICHEMFDLTSRAGIPRNSTEPADRTLNTETTSSIITDYRARVIAGPTRCTR